MKPLEASAACERYQSMTDQMWLRLLPLAGPQALRIFVVRTVVDRGDRSPWLRHIRFLGDGRPAWKSIEESLRPLDVASADASVSDVLNSVAVKAIEQFGSLPVRRRASSARPPPLPTRRAA